VPPSLEACLRESTDRAGMQQEGEVMFRVPTRIWTLVVPAMSAGLTAQAGTPDPWADGVSQFVAGVGGIPGYGDPQTALGAPERFTGEGVFPSAVTAFNPAFGIDEIVSIGEGGSLTLRFAEPILDDPAHPFGADFIVFGNGGFVDASFPFGVVDPATPTFGLDPMRVSVSTNGVDFVTLGDFTEGLFPAQGYLDVTPYSTTPGTQLTDFTRPVDPSLSAADFAGISYAQILALYDGAGGGTPIDISGSGLASISWVRIDVLEDPTADVSVEIDAVATVPEPSTASFVVLVVAASCALRRKK